MDGEGRLGAREPVFTGCFLVSVPRRFSEYTKISGS